MGNLSCHVHKYHYNQEISIDVGCISAGGCKRISILAFINKQNQGLTRRNSPNLGVLLQPRSVMHLMRGSPNGVSSFVYPPFNLHTSQPQTLLYPFGT